MCASVRSQGACACGQVSRMWSPGADMNGVVTRYRGPGVRNEDQGTRNRSAVEDN